MENLQAFIKDCDRKIQIAKKRLEETQDDQDNLGEVSWVHMATSKKTCASVGHMTRCCC